MKREPVRLVGYLLTVALLALPHLEAFGVPITPAQNEALEEFLPAVMMVFGIEFIRTRTRPHNR